MKKILLTLTGFVITVLGMAQSPNLMNYQGVARNAAGNVLPNQPVALRLTVLSGATPGTATSVYSETRNVTTNAFGLFNVVVGSPGAATSTGTIAGINWTAFGAGSGNKFLQVEIDPVGGTNFVNVGATQLVSVPYALNAAGAAPVGPAGGDLTGNYPNPTVAGLRGRTVSAAAPANKNLLMWDAGTTSWIPATAAAAGVVSGTGTLNMVAKWTPDGVTIGNSQIFDNATNVGVGTITPTNKLEVTTAGTTSAGSFSNTNAANTSSTLAGLNQGGTGPAVEGTNTGTGRGGFFQVLNPASTADAVRAETNGTGASWGIRAISSGTNGAGLFQQTNATNTSNNVQSTQAGLGRSGFFTSANAANTANALEVNVAGAGAGLAAISTGTGASGFFNNTNAANVANTVLIDNTNLTGVAYGNASLYARRGTTSGNTFLYINVPSGSIGSSSTGIGLQGTSESVFGVAGLTYTGTGVQAVSLNTGTGLYAQAFGTGITANFVNANTANASNTVLIDNANLTSTAYGNGSVYARRGTTSGNTFLYGGVPTSLTGSASTGIGIQGTSETVFGVAGLSFNGTGVQATSVNSGTALTASALGAAGIAGDFGNSNAANPGNVIRAINANAAAGTTSAATGGGSAIFARKGAALAGFINNPAGIYASSSDAAGVGMAALTYTSFATAGATASTGTGVLGQTFGTGGTAVLAIGTSSPTSYALITAGRVQIQGQGAGNGFVLTSDATGNATWQGPASISLRQFSAAVSIPNAVLTPITQWGTILNEDGGANYNPVTGEYTVPVTGNYAIEGSISWNAFPAASFNIILQLNINGVLQTNNYASQVTAAGQYPNDNIVYFEKRLNAGDKINLLAFQDSGSPVSLLNTPGNHFSVHLIHR